MPGYYYAHVPSMGITTHGDGVEGAMAAARDLIGLWVDESAAKDAFRFTLAMARLERPDPS